MTRRRIVVLSLAAGVAAARISRIPSMRKRARRVQRAARRRCRAVAGRCTGAVLRARLGPPPPHVDDSVIVERVRSALGPVVAALDLPHPHVAVVHGVASLHGDVATPADKERIDHAVAVVSGVRGVDSHLHVGLVPGDTRPSEGRRSAAPSPARHRLLDAARGAAPDVPEHERRVAVGAVLCTLLDRLPDGERAQFLLHLPHDVRDLCPPAEAHRHVHPAHRVGEFMLGVSELAGPVPPGTLKALVRNVLGTLRQLVPEEAADIGAVLPADLRELWLQAVPM